MLLIADKGGSPAAEAAIAASGGRLMQRIAWADAADALSRVVASPVITVATGGVPTELLDVGLPAVRRFLEEMRSHAVVTLDERQIDVVAGHLLDAAVELLCDPTAAQIVAALDRAVAARRSRPALHDSLPDAVQTERDAFGHGPVESDEERLRRLTEAMAQISRYAADVSRMNGGPSAGGLADRRRGFAGEPVAAGQPVTAPEVRRLIQLRQLRAKFFGQFIGEGLFEDPAWDMLLDLFAAELEGNRVSVSSLCIAAGVAPTTALRWITKMTEMGLFIRHPDPLDRRRAFMALSPRASEAMCAYVAAARRVDVG